MTREEFILLRDFICEKTGIFFSENKAYLLQNRISGRLRVLNIGTIGEYYNLLRHGGKRAREELLELFCVVTTNETSFFRNAAQLDALREILKERLGNGKSPFLRVWSAACSTGEEPYTIAILIMEVMEEIGRKIPFLVYGTDINVRALESAKKGVYSPYSLRNVDNGLKEKYFKKTGGAYQVKEELKCFVKIEFSNLVEPQEYAKYRNMDIIFCRNVLIYFTDDMKKKVVRHLYECLNPEGYLILGHAEILHNIAPIFKPIIFPGAIVYKKGGV